MRRCGECGQTVPIRWRNDGPPPQRQHIAGEVVIHRTTARPNYPWGRVADRVQNCSRCDELLVRGIWALFFPAGAPVIEHGEAVPVLVEGISARAISCTADNEQAEILDLSLHYREGGSVTPGPTQCPVCGEEVQQRGVRPATYCSARCRNKASWARWKERNGRVDPGPRGCADCGKTIPWRGGRPATYCSTTCRTRAYRAAEKNAQPTTDQAPGIVLERSRE